MDLRIKVKNNKVFNLDSLVAQLVLLENGDYNIFVEKALVGRAKYFYYRDKIAEHLGYGTSKEKKELHELLKRELLIDVFRDPENIRHENYEEVDLSTKHLSEKGWFKLNQSLEIYAVSQFNFIVTI